MTSPVCRNCGATLTTSFVDLGMSPLSNSYIVPERSAAMEPYYPLHAFVCDRCLLVQVEAFETPENIFGDYAYFSSYSDSWLDHSRRYAEEATARLGLTGADLVAEAASNDGYMLQYFREAGPRVLGVEPARNVAAVAVAKGVTTESVFLGRQTGENLSEKYGHAKLVIANNVIAHVPDLHDFVSGLTALMCEDGTLTIEFPHLLNLIESVQFDTIYHEHFSYYSLHSMERVLERHDLRVWDVQNIPTHGGSLRVWAIRTPDVRPSRSSVEAVREKERAHGLLDLGVYRSFGDKVAKRKRDVLSFLIRAADQGKTVAAYGAPAKGNTLLNYCGIRRDMIAYTVDRNPVKQNVLLPGSHIPVYAPEKLAQTKPNYVFILPWNIRDEVVSQTSFIREWGGQYVVAMPSLEIF